MSCAVAMAAVKMSKRLGTGFTNPDEARQSRRRAYRRYLPCPLFRLINKPRAGPSKPFRRCVRDVELGGGRQVASSHRGARPWRSNFTMKLDDTAYCCVQLCGTNQLKFRIFERPSPKCKTALPRPNKPIGA
jgi:hypothetical protein